VPSIAEIDPVTGSAILINTPYKDLDSIVFSYELRCESKFSQMAEGIVSTFFQVRFYDECHDTLISPAYFDEFDTFAFEIGSRPFYEAQSDKVCGGFTYSIYTPVMPSWPAMTLQNGKIMIDPQIIPTHIGPWDIQIESCLSLTGVCKLGPISRINVLNPCVDSEIKVAPITTILEAPILGTNALSLINEMGPAWPFYDTVDLAYPQVQNCGRIVYEILDMDGNTLPQPPIVYLDGDVLVMQPHVDDPIDIIPLKLRASLADYQFVPIYQDVDFAVKVLPCQARIDSSQVYLSLSNTGIKWGDEAVNYYVGELFNMYV